MIVAAVPIIPPDRGRYWAFYIVNDSNQPIEAIVVESVEYEWGDIGNSERIDTRFGPIAPNSFVEVYRETDTEVRTALTLRVNGAEGPQRTIAKVGRLYARPSGLEPLPILGRDGKLATLARV